MATSQATEMQAEGEEGMDEAVKEILVEMEAEKQDPIEGMGNAQIAEIYKQYYETHGHDAPSHQLTRGIVQHHSLDCCPRMLTPLQKQGRNCWPLNDLRSCANSWDWQSQLNYRSTHHHRRYQNTHRHLGHHGSCQDRTRRGWQLNNSLLRRLKKWKPSQTSSQGGWLPLT